jgi:hypothetical protein
MMKIVEKENGNPDLLNLHEQAFYGEDQGKAESLDPLMNCAPATHWFCRRHLLAGMS